MKNDQINHQTPEGYTIFLGLSHHACLLEIYFNRYHMSYARY